MAKLTDYLPIEQRGKETQQPYRPGPSIFEGLADVAGSVKRMVDDSNQQAAERARRERQARQDALDASDRGSQNYIAEALLLAGSGQSSVMNGPSKPVADPKVAGTQAPLPITQGEAQETALAAEKGNEIGQEAQKLQSGVKQGRISAAQYEMKMEAILREGFRMFPESKFVMLEAIDKYGVNHPIMSEYRSAKAGVEKDEEATSRRENQAIDKAIQMGMDPNLNRETLVAAGYRLITEEEKVKLAREAADFQMKVAGNNREVQKSVQTKLDDQVSEYVHGQLAPQFGTAIEQFTTIMNDSTIPEADRIKAAEQFTNVFRPKAYGLIDRTLAVAVAQHGMTQESADKERTRLRTQVDDVFTQFNSDNPLNIIQTNGKILQSMKDKFGLDVQDAMPVFNQFKEVFGGNVESVQILVDQIASDPALQAVFTRELKGFRGLKDGAGTIRLRNLLAFMGDQNTNLKDYSPEESKQILKDSTQLLNRGFYGLAKGGNVQAQNTVLQTVGKVANAATDLSQGSTTNSHINAINMVANGDFYDVLRRLSPENKELGGLVVDEARVATQKSLIALMGQKSGSGPWQWRLNDRTRRFELIQTGNKGPRMGGITPGGTAISPIQSIDPPFELKAQVAAMNRGIKFLEATSDFEDNAALKNAGINEKFRFYTRGELPAAARPTKSDISGRERISKLQNFWENVQIDWAGVPKAGGSEGSSGNVAYNEDGSRTAKNLAGKEIKIPPVASISSRFADNENFQNVVKAAAAEGVPRDVAIRLAHIESGGTFTHGGANRAGAMGLMQVVGKIHNGLSQEMFGKNVSELTADENIRLGMRILRQNYERRGTWLGAAHDYIGRGEDDGNIKSADYAALVAGEDDGTGAGSS